MRRRYVFREVVGCLRPRFAARSRVLVGVLGEQESLCAAAVVQVGNCRYHRQPTGNRESG
jgi:hypothetical protein